VIGTQPTRRVWRVALREFVTVVVGVLVALAAQAWWEGREERERESGYLQQLEEEARVNETRLVRKLKQDSASLAGATAALAALDGSSALPLPDSVVAWIGRAGQSSSFDMLQGTYRALIGTGDLRLIRNDSLRAIIIGYSAALELENDRQSQIRGAIVDLVPSFAKAVPWMRTIFSGPREMSPAEIAAMQRNPDVSIVLFTLQAATVNRIHGLEATLEDTRRVLAALRAEGVS
jgi:hypothetical protein